MSSAGQPQRRLLLELLRAALAAVEGRGCTRETLQARSAELAADPRPVWAFAIGKAAASMALGAADALGRRLAKVLIVTKDGHVGPEAAGLPGVELFESSHPVPDARSLAAGTRLLELLALMPPDVRPLFLVSGGASSLIDVLAPGVTLAELQRLNSAGLASGMSIEELNAARGAISLIKGGRLAARVHGRAALALLLSDVPGDDPQVIGSGLLGGRADDVERIIVGSIEHGVRAVQAQAGTLACLADPTRYAGDAERLAVRFAHELYLSATPLRVWGGESVVRLPEHPGRGGRNQHLALTAARLLAGYDNLYLLAAGTDGTDGPTEDAGALIDGETCGRAALAGFDVDEALRRFDSGTVLEATGDLLHTGPTGTNVGDLVIGLKLSEAEAKAWLNAKVNLAALRPHAATGH